MDQIDVKTISGIVVTRAAAPPYVYALASALYQSSFTSEFCLPYQLNSRTSRLTMLKIFTWF